MLSVVKGTTKISNSVTGRLCARAAVVTYAGVNRARCESVGLWVSTILLHGLNRWR
jgi:hypothetical protein